MPKDASGCRHKANRLVPSHPTGAFIGLALTSEEKAKTLLGCMVRSRDIGYKAKPTPSRLNMRVEVVTSVAETELFRDPLSFSNPGNTLNDAEVHLTFLLVASQVFTIRIHKILVISSLSSDLNKSLK